MSVVWSWASFVCWTCRVVIGPDGFCEGCDADYREMLRGVHRLHPRYRFQRDGAVRDMESER